MKLKQQTISVSLPTPDVSEVVEKAREAFEPYLMALVNKIENITTGETSRTRRFKLPKNTKRNVKKYSPIFIVVFVVFIIVVVVTRSTRSTSSENPQIKGADAAQVLNRDFNFPLTNGNGEQVSNIKYTLETAELRDEIIVKGQRATAIDGRDFLIITLKISNEYDQAIEMNTRDYIRLMVNDNEIELLAPDIHNDPVEIQAISTKFTRVGFPINETDEDLILRIGEIAGGKESVALELK